MLCLLLIDVIHVADIDFDELLVGLTPGRWPGIYSLSYSAKSKSGFSLSVTPEVRWGLGAQFLTWWHAVLWEKIWTTHKPSGPCMGHVP